MSANEAMYPPEYDQIEPGVWIHSHEDYRRYMARVAIRQFKEFQLMRRFFLSFSGEDLDIADIDETPEPFD